MRGGGERKESEKKEIESQAIKKLDFFQAQHESKTDKSLLLGFSRDIFVKNPYISGCFERFLLMI